MKNCSKIETPVPGDLCFYGSSSSHISHIMIYIGTVRYRPSGVNSLDTVYGSSGGDRRTLNPDIANEMDARVKSHRSHNYRKDFIAFGRLATKDE